MRPTVSPRTGELKASPALRTPLFYTPHAVECEVHRRLRAHPGVRLHSLVVHKTPTGVCLEGRCEVEPDLDLNAMLVDIDGVGEIINHLMPAAPCLTPEASQAFFNEDELFHQG